MHCYRVITECGVLHVWSDKTIQEERQRLVGYGMRQGNRLLIITEVDQATELREDWNNLPDRARELS